MQKEKIVRFYHTSSQATTSELYQSLHLGFQSWRFLGLNVPLNNK